MENECNYCGYTRCMEHHFPEKHDCAGTQSEPLSGG
ncbi:hypothetical protein [Haloquadratum walsbyi]